MTAYHRVRYTADMLTRALASSTNLKEVVAALGLEDSPYRRRYISEKIREYGLDHSQLRGTHHKYPPELLAKAAAQSESVCGVARYVKVAPVGGTVAHLARQLKKYNIDTSHFTGQSHARGMRSPKRRSADQILVKKPEGSGRTKIPQLRRALSDVGVEVRCSGCGTGPSWLGRAMTLEIDHINGDLTDNRRENLRYLCPNCHATTDTYCRKKRASTD